MSKKIISNREVNKYYSLGILFLLILIFSSLNTDNAQAAVKQINIGPLLTDTSKVLMGISGSQVGIGVDPGVYNLNVLGTTNISSTTNVGGSLNVTGAVTAGSFSGNLSGALSSANVSSGSFGSNTGGGDYSFMGDLGIGVASPQAGMKMDVRSDGGDGNSAITAYGYNGNGGIAIHGYGYATAGTGNNYGIIGRSEGVRAAGANMGGYFTASGALTNYALITGTGNVGIGKINPGGAIDVDSAATAAGYWLDGKAALTGESTDNWLRLNANSSWTNGIYSPSILRVDGELRQGSADAGTYGIQTSGSLYSATGAVLAASSGNVGIGTTTPANKLDVAGTINTGTGIGFSEPTSETGYRIKFVDNGGTANDNGIGIGGTAGDENLWLNSLPGTNGAIRFMFGTSGEKVTFKANGSVGIGTTTPGAYKLFVNGDTNIVGNINITGSISGAMSGTLSAANVSSAAFGANTGGGNYNFPGNIGIGVTNPVAKLDVMGQNVNLLSGTGSNTLLFGRSSAENLSMIQDDSNITLESVQDENTPGFGNMIFRVDNDGTADGYFAFQNKAATNFMRINSAGNVGIGTTNPGATLDVNGAIRMSNVGADKKMQFQRTGGNSFSIEHDSSGIYLYNESTTGTMARWYNGGNVYMSGNVGIGITNPASKLDVSGNANASSFSVTPGAGDGLHILSPAGAKFSTQTTTMTGAIKIVLPQSWTNTMMRMKVDVYEYETNESFTVLLGGYNYSPGVTWVNTFAQIIGGKASRDFTVRFGHDGTKNAIWIGETGSTWTYPQVIVSDFYAGYSGFELDKWDDGWDIVFDTDFTGDTMTSTQSANLVSPWVTSGNNIYNLNSGNVGIGTTNPGAYKLYVNGNTNVNGNLTATTFTGALSGSLSAANVSAATFGANTGGGNYVFPGTVTATSFIGNASSATTFSTTRANYKDITDGAVAGQLMWKSYGNNHTIFDASLGTSPSGGVVDRFTPQFPVENNAASNSWGYAPTLMGWNGSSTYGVKVDYARNADTVDGVHAAEKLTAKTITSAVDANTLGDNFLLYGGSTSSWTNRGPSGHNGGGILHVPTHSGGYYSDIWFDTANNRLYSRAVNAGVIGGWSLLPKVTSATTNYVTKWSSADSITNSIIYDNGTSVGIRNSNPTTANLVITPSLTYAIDAGGARIGNISSSLDTDAANVAYVKAASVNSFNTATTTAAGGLNMNGKNIINVNKLTVNTIDPLYNIKGVNYSTFASSIAGGVKEEYVGKTQINSKNSTGEYERVIDFDKQVEGSDLWVWHKTVDFSDDNVQVLITPSGKAAAVYYLISNNKLILKSDKSVTVSYRLIGRRLDWQQWPTRATDQEEKAGFIIK